MWSPESPCGEIGRTVSPRTKDLDFRGFDLVRFAIVRGGIPRSVLSFPEIQTRRFFLCGLLACELTVCARAAPCRRRQAGPSGSPRDGDSAVKAALPSALHHFLAQGGEKVRIRQKYPDICCGFPSSRETKSNDGSVRRRCPRGNN